MGGSAAACLLQPARMLHLQGTGNAEHGLTHNEGLYQVYILDPHAIIVVRQLRRRECSRDGRHQSNVLTLTAQWPSAVVCDSCHASAFAKLATKYSVTQSPACSHAHDSSG